MELEKRINLHESVTPMVSSSHFKQLLGIGKGFVGLNAPMGLPLHLIVFSLKYGVLQLINTQSNSRTSFRTRLGYRKAIGERLKLEEYE